MVRLVENQNPFMSTKRADWLEKLSEIRLAFKKCVGVCYLTNILGLIVIILIVVIRDCLKCGIVHTWGFLGTNLLWDDTSEKM